MSVSKETGVQTVIEGATALAVAGTIEMRSETNWG